MSCSTLTPVIFYLDLLPMFHCSQYVKLATIFVILSSGYNVKERKFQRVKLLTELY